MPKRFLISLHSFLFPLLLLAVLMLPSCLDECQHQNMITRTVPPNCTEQGYTLNTCADCGFSFQTDILPPIGHALTATVYAPTCTEQGYTNYSCACGYRYASNIVPPLGHELTATVHAPTCTEQGYTDYSCACGYQYTSDMVPPLEHELTATVHAPTCTEQGYTDYSCSHCSLSYTTDWIAPMGHSFNVETVEPVSCAVTGHSKYTCSVCQYSYIGDFLFYSDIFDGAYNASTVPLAHGVDISKYNHKQENGEYLPLDFVAIREAGYDFVILKAGSTPRTDENGNALGGIEPTFEADYAAAKEAGLGVGVYFYAYSTTKEKTVQDAELLMEWLDGKQLDYPVYFDIEHASFESMSRREITDLCVTFISTLQQNRYFGALYTNNNWLVNYLQSDKVTFLFDIWYARYPSGDGPYFWNTEKYGQNVGLWQYTNTGIIPEVSDSLVFDFNYAYKDYPAIIKALGYNGYTTR